MRKEAGMFIKILFADICGNGRANVFVHNRKMSLDDIAFSMINRQGLP